MLTVVQGSKGEIHQNVSACELFIHCRFECDSKGFFFVCFNLSVSGNFPFIFRGRLMF